jgi:predicted RNA-binding Zn ribbon-like protein
MQSEFLFDANSLALDLVNTVQVRDGKRIDLLADGASAVAWIRSESEATGRVPTLTASLPSESADELCARLLGVREATRRIADALIGNGMPSGEDVGILNGALEAVPSSARVSGGPTGGYRLERHAVGEGVDGLLLPVVESASRLLTELDWTRLRRCASDRCVLYFYDVSRNRSRRWCSMDRCGNRAKAVAHYHRQRRP